MWEGRGPSAAGARKIDGTTQIGGKDDKDNRSILGHSSKRWVNSKKHAKRNEKRRAKRDEDRESFLTKLTGKSAIKGDDRPMALKGRAKRRKKRITSGGSKIIAWGGGEKVRYTRESWDRAAEKRKKLTPARCLNPGGVVRCGREGNVRDSSHYPRSDLAKKKRQRVLEKWMPSVWIRRVRGQIRGRHEQSPERCGRAKASLVARTVLGVQSLGA